MQTLDQEVIDCNWTHNNESYGDNGLQGFHLGFSPGLKIQNKIEDTPTLMFAVVKRYKAVMPLKVS